MYRDQTRNPVRLQKQTDEYTRTCILTYLQLLITVDKKDDRLIDVSFGTLLKHEDEESCSPQEDDGDDSISAKRYLELRVQLIAHT